LDALVRPRKVLVHERDDYGHQILQPAHLEAHLIVVVRSPACGVYEEAHTEERFEEAAGGCVCGAQAEGEGELGWDAGPGETALTSYHAADEVSEAFSSQWHGSNASGTGLDRVQVCHIPPSSTQTDLFRT